MARPLPLLFVITALAALTACRKDPQADAGPKPSASSYGFLPEAPSETAPAPPPTVVPIPQKSADYEVTPEQLLGDTKTLEKVKTDLKAKVAAGTATETDRRLLRAICKKLGDKTCAEPGKDTEVDFALGDRAKLMNAKNALKAKVASGAGTDADKRLLRGLCRQLGDMSCIK